MRPVLRFDEAWASQSGDVPRCSGPTQLGGVIYAYTRLRRQKQARSGARGKREDPPVEGSDDIRQMPLAPPQLLYLRSYFIRTIPLSIFYMLPLANSLRATTRNLATTSQRYFSSTAAAMGVTKNISKEGSGASPVKGDKVTIEYTGYLKDTTKPDNKGKQYAHP